MAWEFSVGGCCWLRSLRRCTITTHDFPLCYYLQENTAAVLRKVNGIPNTLIPDFLVHVGWCCGVEVRVGGAAVWGVGGFGGISWDKNDGLVYSRTLSTCLSVALDS